jgi:hypothetical protein
MTYTLQSRLLPDYARPAFASPWCPAHNHESADGLAEKEVRRRAVADSLPTKGLAQHSTKERSLGERFGLDF